MADRTSLRSIRPRAEAATSMTTPVASSSGSPAVNRPSRADNGLKRIHDGARSRQGRPPRQFPKNVLRQAIRLYHKSDTSIRQICKGIQAEGGGNWQTVLKAIEDVIGVDKKNGDKNQRLEDAEKKKSRAERQHNAYEYYKDRSTELRDHGDNLDTNNGLVAQAEDPANASIEQDGQDFSDIVDWDAAEPSRKRARMEDSTGDPGRDMPPPHATSRNVRDVDMIKVAERLDAQEGNTFPKLRFIVERGSPTASSIWTSLSQTLYSAARKTGSLALALTAFQSSGRRPQKKALDEYRYYHKMERDPSDEGLSIAQMLKRAIDTYFRLEAAAANGHAVGLGSNADIGLVSFLCKAHAYGLTDAVLATEIKRQLRPVRDRAAVCRLVRVADSPRKVTALHLAVAYGYYDVCKVLEEFGANLYAQTAGKNSIYHFAQRAEHEAKEDLFLYSNISRCREHFHHCPPQHSSTWAGRDPHPVEEVSRPPIPRRSETTELLRAPSLETGLFPAEQPAHPFIDPGLAQPLPVDAPALPAPNAASQPVLQNHVANASHTTISTVESQQSIPRTWEEFGSMLAPDQPLPPTSDAPMDIANMTFDNLGGETFDPTDLQYFAIQPVSQLAKPTTPDSGYRTQTTGDAYSADSSGSAFDGMSGHGADISRATASHGQLQQAQDMVQSPLSDKQYPFPSNTATTDFLTDQEDSTLCRQCFCKLTFDYSPTTSLPRFWCPNGHGAFESKLEWHPASS